MVYTKIHQISDVARSFEQVSKDFLDIFSNVNAMGVEVIRYTEKAFYVSCKIFDSGENTKQSIYEINFWCPKKLLWKNDSVPFWFIKEKIDECLKG